MTAIRLAGAGRTYAIYSHPFDRLLEILTKRPRRREIDALRPTDLAVPKGQVLGLIGSNGAGKSTLLKLIAATLSPSTGEVRVAGSVGALLELGGGFHPDMTGRDNVFLKGAIMGVPREEMRSRYQEITAFAGIGDFMDQPVKTYSSGMFMRLAFAVATCVEPDILLIDEALSVGDGAFARKSFDRIMQFKAAGRTILFCSHSLYQVEAICDRVVWLDRGAVRGDGEPAAVVAAYNDFLDGKSRPQEPVAVAEAVAAPSEPEASPVPSSGRRPARLHRVKISADGVAGPRLTLRTGESDLEIQCEFVADSSIANPTLAATIARTDGQVVCSAGSRNDGVVLDRGANGRGRVGLCFPRLALLKGTYVVNVYLLCEHAIHCYDKALMVAELQVAQKGLEQGLVSLPRQWRVGANGRA